MKLRYIWLSLLACCSTLTHATSYMRAPFELKGQWNNGSESIRQTHTRLVVYINHKQRGPFEGTYYKYQSGEHLISVNFPDDPDCCTGRVENGGKTIRWSNNSVWTKDVVAPLPQPIRPVPVIPPPRYSGANAPKTTYHDGTITVQGYRLDWCLKRGTQCGKPAADAWCEHNNRTKLSSHATAFKQAPDIGRFAPTYILGDRALCQSAGCDGFESITCELYGD